MNRGPGGNQQQQQQQHHQNNTNQPQNAQGGAGKPMNNVQNGGPRNAKPPLKFENDYDFEQANTKFEELRSQLANIKVGEELKQTEQVLFFCYYFLSFIQLELNPRFPNGISQN